MLTQNIFINRTIPQSERTSFDKKRSDLANYLELGQTHFNTLFKTTIQSKYQQNHRSYHNLSHIISFLKIANEFEIQNRKSFEIAVWFHDIIYQPYFKNNEERSWLYFEKYLVKHQIQALNVAEIEWVKDAILSTYGHQPRSNDPDLQLFLDIDLAILGTDWDIYKNYTQAIKKEYWIYPANIYKKGRAKAMKHFLSRNQIYFTPYFERFETQARENIERELNGLLVD